MRAVVLVLALSAAGCNTDDKPPLVIDLSKGTSASVVDFPGGTTAFRRSDTDVVLLLPGEGRFENHGDVYVVRAGQFITTIEVQLDKDGTDAAYQTARALAVEWGLDPGNLDRWHDRRVAGREEGNEDFTDTFNASTASTEPIDRGGGLVEVSVRYSFDDDEPVIPTITFFWGG